MNKFLNMVKWREGLYPFITDEVSAKKAASYGYMGITIAASFNLIILSLNLIPALMGQSYQSAAGFFDVIIMLIIGFFIYKMSRVAAVAGLLYVLSNIIYKVYIGESTNFVLQGFLILWLISGVRGTFAYRNYLNNKK